MKKVLIVVDMQNDFVTGVLGSKYAQDIVPNVVKKVKTYENNGDIIVVTKDIHKENYLNTREGKHLPVKHCSFELGRQLIDELLKYNECETTIHKKDKFGLGLDELFILEKVIFGKHYPNHPSEAELEFEIVGIVTNLCIISVATSLQNYFYNSEITIDASCCASYDPILHEKALDVMEGLQFNVINR